MQYLAVRLVQHPSCDRRFTSFLPFPPGALAEQTRPPKKLFIDDIPINIGLFEPLGQATLGSIFTDTTVAVSSALALSVAGDLTSEDILQFVFQK